jgi:hypothetical protein
MGRVPTGTEWDENCPDRFIEPVCENKISTLLEGGAKSRLLGDSVGSCVGELVPDAGLFGPRGDETPLEHHPLTLAAFRLDPDGEDRLRRSDVVPGLEERQRLQAADEFGDLRPAGLQGETATHETSPSRRVAVNPRRRFVPG